MDRTPNPFAVRVVQVGILAAFSAFVIGLIVWIYRLIGLSFELGDTPSASVAISLLAIPVFLLLLGLANYVVWGLLLSASKEKASGKGHAGGHSER